MLFFVFCLVHSHRQIYLSEVKLFFEIKLHGDLGCWVDDGAPSMSLAVGFTLMKNIHLMFFVPYNLFHTHSFHITKYKINIYMNIKYTNCTKTERY